MFKVDDPIKYRLGDNKEEIEFFKNKFKVEPHHIRGKVLSISKDYYLIELDIEIFGDRIIGFYESEIELDIQRKREQTLEDIFS